MEVFTVKKEQYERAELEIIQFQTEDVITTSDPMKKFLPERLKPLRQKSTILIVDFCHLP